MPLNSQVYRVVCVRSDKKIKNTQVRATVFPLRYIHANSIRINECLCMCTEKDVDLKLGWNLLPYPV